tara:strand:- start:1594 stop:2712 length:1119 start_codon:yes stop_codon:yes gene_type:complete
MDNKNHYDSFFYDWWKNLDKVIFFLFITLIIFGIFFSLVSTSLIASSKFGTNNYYFFLRHLIYVLLGLIVIVFFSSIREKDVYKISAILFFIFFISLLLVPFFGEEVKGSKRWLDFPFLPRFQPIEFLKPFLIIFLSLTIGSRFTSNNYFKFFLSTIIVLPILLLLALQPDIGQTLLISFVWLSLVFVSGINLYVLNFLIFLFLSILGYLVFYLTKFSYIKYRIVSFFDLKSKGNYQSQKATDAIIDGGFFGKGIGEGTLNARVPEAHTDYVISVISEEFGVLFILIILMVFLILIFRVFKKVPLEKKNSNKLILIGSILLIIFQVLIHIGVNIRLLPTTGMTLPFLSYGGSSILSCSILAGLILNFTKRNV